MAINELPSGKWRVQVRAPGFYRAGSFDLKREAIEANAQWKTLAKAAKVGGYVTPPPGTTVADAIDRYVELVPNTWGRSKRMSLELLKRELGTVQLKNLTAGVLREFIDKRLATSKGMAVTIYLSTLSGVLKWLKHARGFDIDERLALNARAAMAHRTGVQTRGKIQDRLPKEGELEALYSHWQAKGKRQKVPMELVCRILLASGMRCGELCRIRVEDLDHKAMTVVIRDRKDPRNKSGNDQTVPLILGAWELIEPLAKGRKAGFVIPNLNPHSVSNLFTRAAKACGFEGLTLHSLRHAAITEMFRQGLDIPTTSLVSGHKTLAQLKRYTHTTPADVHRKLAEHKKLLTRQE